MRLFTFGLIYFKISAMMELSAQADGYSLHVNIDDDLEKDFEKFEVQPENLALVADSFGAEEAIVRRRRAGSSAPDDLVVNFSTVKPYSSVQPGNNVLGWMHSREVYVKGMPAVSYTHLRAHETG